MVSFQEHHWLWTSRLVFPKISANVFSNSDTFVCRENPLHPALVAEWSKRASLKIQVAVVSVGLRFESCRGWYNSKILPKYSMWGTYLSALPQHTQIYFFNIGYQVNLYSINNHHYFTYTVHNVNTICTSLRQSWLVDLLYYPFFIPT